MKPDMLAFIHEHHVEIDKDLRALGARGPYSDEERELFVINDEGWYNLALLEGVDI